MPVSRMDLDMRGAGSPHRIVSLILKAEPNLPIPVPIEDLCRQLDITSIERQTLDGAEGALITDTSRSSGIILVNQDGHPFRQRFTIGHELGHFLIPTHIPNADNKFLCSRADMLLSSANESDRRSKMEVEANQFSSLILIPPPVLKTDLRTLGEPNIECMLKLAHKFQVSGEAMARAYAEYHSEPIAFVIVKDGVVQYSAKNLKFPFITVGKNQKVPDGSQLNRTKKEINVASEISGCLADTWINVERGRKAPTLFEQTIKLSKGRAIVMLWVEPLEDEEEDEDENRTSRERLQYRQSRNRW